MTLDERLERLAHSLRAQGAIHGPERDLMVDAAELIRDLRVTQLLGYQVAEGDGTSVYELQARARGPRKESSR